MTVDEAARRKDRLEESLREMLEAFTRETGAVVTYIGVDALSVTDANGRSRRTGDCSVRVTAEIG